MPTINLDGSPSWEHIPGAVEPGSLRGRRVAVEKLTTRGVCFVRETFRCPAAAVRALGVTPAVPGNVCYGREP